MAQDSYDPSGWDQAFDELKGMSLTDETRAIYEELAQAFPTKADLWCKYAELELGTGNLTSLKSIFQRCLMTVPSLELWALYMKFIRRCNKDKGPDGAVEVRNALDFTLDVVGQDINSGPFWQDAIQHMLAPKPGSPEFVALFPQAIPGQEDQARMAAVRRLYQRAVCVPHHHLDGLWRDYQRFENDGPVKQFAKKVLDEWSPRYQAAKAVHRERRRRAAALSYALWPLPPGRGGLLQEQQAALWRDYLAYERSNPQSLDAASLQARVALAYDQALIAFFQFPEFWLDYADWHAGCGRPDASAATLSKAQAALPGCLQLRLAAADLAERTGAPEQAVAIYEGLALNLEAQAAAARGVPPPPDAPPLLPLSPEQGELLWVAYMQLLRRVEGDFHSRKLFLRARRWHQSLPGPGADAGGAPTTPSAASSGGPACWRLYAEAAMLEWRLGRDAAAARNIFEKGLEDPRVGREPQYVLAYLDLLLGLGDVDNARALLVRALADEANARSVTLWQRYLAFEGMAGDLASVMEVERRAAAALRGEEAEALRAALPLTRRDLNFLRSPTELRRLLGLPTAPEHFGPGAAGAQPGGGAGGPGAAIRHPSAYAAPSAKGGGGPEAPLKQLPPQLGLFINSLPPPQAVEGLVPDVDGVVEALLALDLTPQAVLQTCLDVESGKVLAALQAQAQGGGPPAEPGPFPPHHQPPPHHLPPHHPQHPHPHGRPQEPFGRSEPGPGGYGGPPPPYGYGQGSPGPGPGPGPGGYPPGPGGPDMYGDGPPGPGGPDEYGKRRFNQYGYDPNEGDDEPYDSGYGGGRDLYHQRLRRRMDG